MKTALLGEMKSLFILFKIAFSGAVLFLGFYQNVIADENDSELKDFKPIISEIMYNHPLSGSDLDWIEVYNDSENTTTLEGEGSSNKMPFSVCRKKEENNCKSNYNNPVYFSDKTLELDSGEVFVIAKNPDEFIKRYSDKYPEKTKILKSGFSLTIGGEVGIYNIKKDENGDDETVWLDRVEYDSAWGADKNGKSLEKIEIDKSGGGSNWTESETCEGTPGEKYGKSNEETYSEDIFINELLPNPSAGEEWIEIFNAGDKDEILNCWTLKDKAKKYVFFDEEIGAEKYLVVEKSRSGIDLNKTDEKVELLSPAIKNNLVSEVSYKKMENPDWSLARTDEGGYEWTSIPTKGGKNEFLLPIKYSSKIFINEIMPNPIGKDQEGEWIEIYNAEAEDIDLTGWSIADDSGKRYFFKEDVIKKGGYLVVKYEKSKISLNNGGDKLILANPLSEEAGTVAYEKVPKEGEVWARKDNGKFAWTDIATPGKKNQFPIPKAYSSAIRFNEILPNPDGVDKGNEWIELFNESDEKVDLDGWMIENRSGKKYIIEKVSVDGGGFVLIEIKNSSFSVRNSNEILRLLDPNGEMTAGVSFLGSAKSGVSYNRNGNNEWKWSRFLTPNKENIFNNPPQIEIDFKKRAYKDVRIYFDASGTHDRDGDKLKFKWDFGDNHKSYLEKTSHIFEEEGKYEIKLFVSDGSEEAVKSFEIEVEDFPRKDLEIVSLMPNPKGKDSDNEFVEIKNNSKKKVNIKGYYLATGKEEKTLVNHPVSDDLEIGSGRTEKVERKICKIILPNKEGVVELRYPDKKTADQVKYSKDKIEEDEKYALVEGGWIWISNRQSAAQPAENAPIAKSFFNVGLTARVGYPELSNNQNKGICECFLRLKTENWKFKNKKWLSLANTGFKIEI